jgi:hypothetical protein
MKAARRKALPSSKFAYPASRKYPIDTAPRARNALSRAAQSGTSGSYSHVLRKIKSSSNPAVRAVGKRSAKRGRR